MTLGTLAQKAPRGLSIFVIMCAVIITSLLYVLQKSEAIGNNLVSIDGVYTVE